MDKNLKIGLILAVLVLILGLGYFMLTEKSIPNFSEQSLLPSASAEAESSQQPSFQPETGSVDDFIASLESDSYSENSLFHEESTGLDQSLSSESQAISDFGQSYDSSEL